ncbi:MAG: extensin family protein, partial [Pseudomonadota bacterium]
GRAIDISAFYLRDGTEVSVLTGWNARSTSRAMRQMHRAACGPFGTVLGPESDRFHRDHFHFDTAQHRGGAYCR